MAELHLFDFDGTITSEDSFIGLARHLLGTRRLALALGRNLPGLVLMALGLRSGGRVKEAVFGSLFRGMPLKSFLSGCEAYALTHRDILRPEALERIDALLAAGHSVAIVSASLPQWIEPFMAGRRVRVIGTEPEVVRGRLTGRFATPNCHGEEKVRRVLRAYRPEAFTAVEAYGDTAGDRPMLAMATRAHFRPFRH